MAKFNYCDKVCDKVLSRKKSQTRSAVCDFFSAQSLVAGLVAVIEFGRY